MRHLVLVELAAASGRTRLVSAGREVRTIGRGIRRALLVTVLPLRAGLEGRVNVRD